MNQPANRKAALRFAALLAMVILAALVTVGVAFGTGEQLRSALPLGGLLALALLARLLLFARPRRDDDKPE